MTRPILFLLTLTLLLPAGCAHRRGETEAVQRGRELVRKAGCNDCHTEGYLNAGGKVLEERWLTGSKLGFRGPWGVRYPANLRLLLNRLDEQQWVAIARVMRSNSPMAWSQLPHLKTRDLRDIYQYVRWLGPAGEPAPPALPPGVPVSGEVMDFPSAH